MTAEIRELERQAGQLVQDLNDLLERLGEDSPTPQDWAEFRRLKALAKAVSTSSDRVLQEQGYAH